MNVMMQILLIRSRVCNGSILFSLRQFEPLGKCFRLVPWSTDHVCGLLVILYVSNKSPSIFGFLITISGNARVPAINLFSMCALVT